MTQEFKLTITITDDGDGPSLKMKTENISINGIKMMALYKMLGDLVKSSIEGQFNAAHDFSIIAAKLSEIDIEDE